MAIFFSQGYAVEDAPKKPVICAPAVYVTQVDVMAFWPRNAGPC